MLVCGWRDVPQDIIIKEKNCIYFSLDFPVHYKNIEIIVFWTPQHVHNKIYLEYEYICSNKSYNKEKIYFIYKVDNNNTITSYFKIKNIDLESKTILCKLKNVNIVRIGCNFNYEKK
jgi:hypothetical protein